MDEYLQKVVLPFIDDQREALDLPLRQRALVILDLFKAHRMDTFVNALKDHGVLVVFVPGGCTGELQPLDISGNGFFKETLKGLFRSWYADQVAAAYSRGLNEQQFRPDTRLSTLKPIHARWLVQAVDALSQKPELLIKGFELAGIKDAVDTASTS
jgi:hypothetical protein